MKEIIDFHAHVYPDGIAEKVVSSIEDFYQTRRRHDGTLTSLLGSLEGGSVDYVIVLPVASKPEHFKTNQWYANLATVSKQIIPFGSIHPDNSPSDLEKFPAWNLRGIKFQPNAQLFYPDEKRMFPFYQKAEELGLTVTFHIGNEHGNVLGKFSQPERYVEVLRSFPDLKVILPHLGGYMTWDRLELILGFPHVYFDTAYLPGNIEDALFLELIERIGLERVLFGTDFPFRDHAEEVAHVRRLLGEEAEIILSENPKRILGLA